MRMFPFQTGVPFSPCPLPTSELNKMQTTRTTLLPASLTLSRRLLTPRKTTMKTGSWLIPIITLFSFCAKGQVSPTTADPVIIERGAHHQVWQTVSVDEQGQTNVSSFTEVATGLNFLDITTGEYLPSKESFEIAADGAALAAHGQHRVRLESDINSGGSVDLLMP